MQPEATPGVKRMFLPIVAGNIKRTEKLTRRPDRMCCGQLQRYGGAIIFLVLLFFFFFFRKQST